MRYLTEINAFERLMDRHPLPGTAQLLWYKLMREANRQRWPDSIQLDQKGALQLIGASINTFLKARTALSDAGLLEFSQGVKGQI